MSHSTECPCGRPRAGCEYHDPALQSAEPPTVRDPLSPEARAILEARRRMRTILNVKRDAPQLRLLGPDDPEVSSDLIYLDEATGGLVAMPR